MGVKLVSKFLVGQSESHVGCVMVMTFVGDLLENAFVYLANHYHLVLNFKKQRVY